MKQGFLRHVKETDFTLSRKGLGFFHTVMIIFYPECNRNPLERKICSNW
jgi:hypothetical protein